MGEEGVELFLSGERVKRLPVAEPHNLSSTNSCDELLILIDCLGTPEVMRECLSCRRARSCCLSLGDRSGLMAKGDLRVDLLLSII